MRSSGTLDLEQPRNKRARGLHGSSCPKCGTGVGFNARHCRRCGTAVSRSDGVALDAVSEDSIRLQQGDLRDNFSTLSTGPSPSNVTIGSKDISDSEGDTNTAPPVRAMYGGSSSKPPSYAKQKLLAGGYGYHGSSPYAPVHSSPPPAKRQNIGRRPKIPRRALPKIPKQGGSTLLTPFGGMPRAGVREHTVSLRLEHVQKTLRPLLLRFMQHTSNRGVFNDPVDKTLTYNGVEYCKKIRNPMDFGTIKTKLQGLQYHTPEAFAHDMRLVFSNAMVFYSPTQDLHAAASTMSAEFEAEYDKLVKKAERGNVKKGEHACSLCQGETCALCGAKCLKYEPPAIVCDGPCAMRLRRGATFYITHDGTRLWCQKCHSGLNSVLPPPDGTDGMSEYMDPEEREKFGENQPPPKLLYKRDLLRRKFDEEIAEPWVQCDSCSRWVHQICAGFNERSNATPAGEGARFCCPECEANTKVPAMKISVKVCGESSTVLDARPKESKASLDTASCTSGAASVGSVAPTEAGDNAVAKVSNQRWWSAEDLPHCAMGDFIETKCNQRMAELLNCKIDGLGDKRVTIRVVSHLESSCEVNYAVRKFFHAPRHLPYHSKALMMFQKVDGIDIALWCMYVQEYGANCPDPSTRRVYVAYLDSVEFFRPRHVRTHIYHEILVSYLAWVAARGFGHAHIWACPPYRGNNFIFWCHPSHQRTPSSERLVQWYRTMLERGKAVGAVSEVRNLYKESFQIFSMDIKDHKTKSELEPDWDPMEDRAEPGQCPPIFDGDMWMDEAVVVNRRFTARMEQMTEGGSSPHDGCMQLLKKIMRHPSAYPFNTPVDAVALKIPQYLKLIAQPMDLGTVKKRLQEHDYLTLRPLVHDVRLTFLNAKEFNPPKHPVHTMASSLLTMFDKEIRFLLAKYQVRIPAGKDLFSLEISTKVDQENAQKDREAEKKAASETSSAPPAPAAPAATPTVTKTESTPQGSQGDCDAVTSSKDTKDKEELSTSRSAPPLANGTAAAPVQSTSLQSGSLPPASSNTISENVLETAGEKRPSPVSPTEKSSLPSQPSSQVQDTKSTVETPASLPPQPPREKREAPAVDSSEDLPRQTSSDTMLKVLENGAAKPPPPPIPALAVINDVPTLGGSPRAVHNPPPLLRPDPPPLGGGAARPPPPPAPPAHMGTASMSPAAGGARPGQPMNSSLHSQQAMQRANAMRQGQQSFGMSHTPQQQFFTPGYSTSLGSSPLGQSPSMPRAGFNSSVSGAPSSSPMYGGMQSHNTMGANRHPQGHSRPLGTPATPASIYSPRSEPSQVRSSSNFNNGAMQTAPEVQWNLPPPRKMDWQFVSAQGGRVRLRCTPKPKRVPVIEGVTAADIVLPPPRKVPSIAAEYKLPLMAQVARVIEKMKNDFFVVKLCPPGTDCPEGKLMMDELPKHGVENGPSSGAGRRRKAATKKKAQKLNEERAAKRQKTGHVPEDDMHLAGSDPYGLSHQEPKKEYVKSENGALEGDGSSQVHGSASYEHEDVKSEIKSEFSEGGKHPGVKSEPMDIDVMSERGNVNDSCDIKSEVGDADCKKDLTSAGAAPKIKFAGGLEVNPILNDYLANASLPDTALMEDTKDPDPLCSTPFVDSRHTFLEMCQWRHFQFDTLRRAKHASLMSLYHLHNRAPVDNKAHAAHCAECGKQIKGVRWHCSVCPDFELCSTCNTHDPNNPTLHPHLLTPYRVSYEGELRA